MGGSAEEICRMTTHEPWASIITIPQIWDLHVKTMAYTGHTPHQHDPKEGCIESSLGSAWHAQHYRQEDGVRPGLLFAVYLMHHLITNHCFKDGNKRIGWACMIYVLSEYNLALKATDEEADQLMTKVLDKSMDIDDVVRWIADGHLEEMQEG
jgi:prophage maintenance system killer protein